eukprot:3691258-Amphidinium_carterae.2
MHEKRDLHTDLSWLLTNPFVQIDAMRAWKQSSRRSAEGRSVFPTSTFLDHTAGVTKEHS